MKRVVCTLLILILLCSCAPQSGLSSESENSSSESSFSVASQQVSSNFSSSSAPPIPFSAITYEDIPDMSEIFTEEYNANFEKEFEEKQQEPEDDWIAKMNNEADLSALTETDELVSSAMTWRTSGLLLDNSKNSSFYLSFIETIYGFDAAFSRQTGEFFDDRCNETAFRMYTVFESEMGGYIYCFFNYYPLHDYTVLKATVYVPEVLHYSQFEQLKVGDSIDDVAAITKTELFLKKNVQTYTIKHSIHWLVDGILYLEYDDALNITEIYYGEDFILPNPFLYFNTEDDDHFNNLPESLYDFTILPQDYPQ